MGIPCRKLGGHGVASVTVQRIDQCGSFFASKSFQGPNGISFVVCLLKLSHVQILGEYFLALFCAESSRLMSAFWLRVRVRYFYFGAVVDGLCASVAVQ